MPETPAIQFDLSPAMIAEVMDEWERDHPGHKAHEMSKEEFGDRMMKKIEASAKFAR